MLNILCTGGCGFIGSVLVPKLLKLGHRVVVIDTQWFGSYLEPHENLTVARVDIRETNIHPLGGTDAVIHLAGIVNDASGLLDPKLTWETNALATMQLADRAVRNGVKQFIYASSGSVYGICDAPNVTEDLPLYPLSEYNKTKMVAERVLKSYSDKMAVQILRPATVCGWSPRMRLDVMVNSFTMQALTKGVIRYNGGSQMRPNIHIEDMTDLYLWMLDRPNLTGVYNAGFENMSVGGIATLVARILDAQTDPAPSTDARSYRLNSDKLISTGFRPKKTIQDAIFDLIRKYQMGQLKDDPKWYSLQAMPKA